MESVFCRPHFAGCSLAKNVNAMNLDVHYQVTCLILSAHHLMSASGFLRRCRRERCCDAAAPTTGARWPARRSVPGIPCNRSSATNQTLAPNRKKTKTNTKQIASRMTSSQTALQSLYSLSGFTGLRERVRELTSFARSRVWGVSCAVLRMTDKESE